jgi:hypothetical protein
MSFFHESLKFLKKTTRKTNAIGKASSAAESFAIIPRPTQKAMPMIFFIVGSLYHLSVRSTAPIERAHARASLLTRLPRKMKQG